MSKTGGGRGTNQYAIKGVSKQQAVSRGEPAVGLSFPTPSVVHAGVLTWGAESEYDLSDFTSTTPERAVWRLQQRKTSLVFNDAKLEGNTFTEPQVQTLLEGNTVEADSDFEANQILALSEGTDLVLQRVLDGNFKLNKDTSDAVHRIVADFEAIDAGMFRGEGTTGGGGSVNAMGLSFKAPATGVGGADLRHVFDEGLSAIGAISHPLLQGVTYAAFAAYNQFYFDGNKRTSRLMMNGALMSNGFDAIVTPAGRKAEYNQSLRHMYEFGDARPYIRFTLSCYDDVAR